jgi:hydrogenase expression/formation protein HypE
MVGEDAGVIDIAAGALIVATDPITLTGKDVGAHAVAINANDVAVMGARPRWFLAVVLLPPGTSESEIRELFEAMHIALTNLSISLVGGHTEITNAVTQPVVVGQMMGLREDGGFVPTGGLTPGDAVVQVGPAPIEGAAVLAAEAPAAIQRLPHNIRDAALEALHNPGISVVDAALKAAELGAIAMHDPTEGGLSAGLHELAEASGLALSIDAGAILWFEPGCQICTALNLDPWGVLASGTLLAGFSFPATESACRELNAAGFSASVIAIADNGQGVRFADGTDLARFERDEISRLSES